MMCKQGCIKHGRGASQGADLTLMKIPQDPAPSLTFPLTLLVRFTIRWLTREKCPVPLPGFAERFSGGETL